MTRIFALAAVAALIAAPASAQSVKIDLAGKSNAQVQADIQKAARTVCGLAVVGASFPREMYDSCYKHAVKDANARLSSQVASTGQAGHVDHRAGDGLDVHGGLRLQ
jgi:gas vesicle protein